MDLGVSQADFSTSTFNIYQQYEPRGLNLATPPRYYDETFNSLFYLNSSHMHQYIEIFKRLLSFISEIRKRGLAQQFMGRTFKATLSSQYPARSLTP